MPANPDKFAADVEKGIVQSGGKEAIAKLCGGMSDVAVGKSVVNGAKANVPTKCKITIEGKTLQFKGNARMIKKGGAWKWDLTFEEDPQKATSMALQELIGKPANANAPVKPSAK